MDGYSVQEAASVLGVAEGRVWELLARGVLLGTPEGDSMRVFLKAQPGPITRAADRDEPQRTNGNGGSHGADGEASAFRELLTEFRNLTERYGQALLALGEARGEVAGLRSRVDQLEARFDLRLPPPIDAAPVAWESATIPAAEPEGPSVIPSRAAPRPAPAQPKPRARKPRTTRDAVAGFADALARAQDPSAAELGESRADAAAETEASAATVPMDAQPLEQPVERATEPRAEPPVMEAAAEEQPLEAIPTTDVAEVADVPEVAEVVVPEAAEEEIPVEAAEEEIPVEAAAEAIVVGAAAAAAAELAAEAEPPTYSAVVVEPDWFADGDFAWLDAADIEAGGPEASEAGAAAEPVLAEPAAEPVLEEPALEPEPPSATSEEPPAAQVAQEPEPVPEPLPPEPAPEPEPVPGFEAEAEFESWQPPVAPVEDEAPASPVAGASASTDIDDAPERQTMSAAVAVEELEEEVMWLGAAPTPVAQDEPLPQPRAESRPWPAVDSAPQVTEMVRPPLAMTEDELARLALDEGWDEAEVAAIRAIITPIPTTRVDLPGAAELHDAMAALEAVPVRSDPRYDASRQWAKPAPEDAEPPRQDDWAFEAEPEAPPKAPPPAAPRSQSDVTSALRRSVADPGWLRRRQGPAAAAYRRLRRLLPG